MRREEQTRPIRGEDTRERPLDTAEKLMASTSTVAISLRDFTSHANTNLAAVNYHFGSKEALVDAVVRRTAERLHTAWNESPGEIESESCDSPMSLAVILQSPSESRARRCGYRGSRFPECADQGPIRVQDRTGGR
jgi:AcrR family transcriptional regulator